MEGNVLRNHVYYNSDHLKDRIHLVKCICGFYINIIYSKVNKDFSLLYQRPVVYGKKEKKSMK